MWAYFKESTQKNILINNAIGQNNGCKYKKKILEKLEIVNLLRSENIVNEEVKMLNREMEALKNHIRPITKGQPHDYTISNRKKWV